MSTLERLAAIAHEQWADADARARRGRMGATSYADLTEDEKERARAWARKVMQELDVPDVPDGHIPSWATAMAPVGSPEYNDLLLKGFEPVSMQIIFQPPTIVGGEARQINLWGFRKRVFVKMSTDVEGEA